MCVCCQHIHRGRGNTPLGGMASDVELCGSVIELCGSVIELCGSVS